MYREQVWFVCPFTHAKWRSKSYTAYRLKEGINYAQFLRLPPLKASNKSTNIPIDYDENVAIQLSETTQDAEYKFVDETPRLKEFGEDVLPPPEGERDFEERGSTRVYHDGKLLKVDKSDGYLEHDEDDQNQNIIEHLTQTQNESQQELRGSEEEDAIPILQRKRPRKAHPKTRNSTKITTSNNPKQTTNINNKKAKVQDASNKIQQELESLMDQNFEVDIKSFADKTIEDEMEALQVKNKAYTTQSHDSFKAITQSRHKLPRGSEEHYHKWLIEVHQIDPKLIPREPTHTKVKPGILLPYPSGSKWRELRGIPEAHMAKVTLGENRYMDMLANDGIEFAKAISSITPDSDYSESDNDEGEGLQAHYTKMTYKDLKGILRAKKKKDARLSKAVGSGEEQPPKDLKEAFNHPTRGQEWRKSALTEFQGLTDMGVFDHDYTWEDLEKLNIDVNGHSPPINISVALTHKYGADGELDRLKTRMAVAGLPG